MIGISTKHGELNTKLGGERDLIGFGGVRKGKRNWIGNGSETRARMWDRFATYGDGGGGGADEGVEEDAEGHGAVVPVLSPWIRWLLALPIGGLHGSSPLSSSSSPSSSMEVVLGISSSPWERARARKEERENAIDSVREMIFILKCFFFYTQKRIHNISFQFTLINNPNISSTANYNR